MFAYYIQFSLKMVLIFAHYGKRIIAKVHHTIILATQYMIAMNLAVMTLPCADHHIVYCVAHNYDLLAARRPDIPTLLNKN